MEQIRIALKRCLERLGCMSVEHVVCTCSRLEILDSPQAVSHS